MTLAGALDAVLEATVVPSFSRIGPRLRSRIFHWSALPALDGRVVLVTGATSGLGETASIELARLGAGVRLLGRDAGRVAAAVTRVRSASGNDDVHGDVADLNDLSEVRSFAARFAGAHGRLDALVHNAGSLVADHRLSVDGIERTVQTHLVAPFLLTRLLLAQLEASTAGRVVWVSSGGMYLQRLSVEDLEMPAATFDGATAYSRAKRAQVALVRHWAPGLATRGIGIHAMHPGWADTPGLASSLPRFHRLLRPLLRTPAEGADTMVWLAAGGAGSATSGDLWLDRRRRSAHKVPWTRRSDEAAEAARLFEWCEERAAP
ncbi:MAG: SDR family NAD(P)-dependent oxidoreductase [Acidimicrobiia bacterium]